VRTGSEIRLPALVAIPENVQRIKKRTPRLARAWQQGFRRTLALALACGGEVVDVARRERGGGVWYVIDASKRGAARPRRGSPR
jgi:hypothetical protein